MMADSAALVFAPAERPVRCPGLGRCSPAAGSRCRVPCRCGSSAGSGGGSYSSCSSCSAGPRLPCRRYRSSRKSSRHPRLVCRCCLSRSGCRAGQRRWRQRQCSAGQPAVPRRHHALLHGAHPWICRGSGSVSARRGSPGRPRRQHEPPRRLCSRPQGAAATAAAAPAAQQI